MSLLPGVPNMSPAPISPVKPITAGANTDVGKPSGINAIAHSVGKPGNVENLGSIVGRPGKGMTSVGGGNQTAHMLNHYGKPPANPQASSSLVAGLSGTGGVDPTAHAGANKIRGMSGGIHRVRNGGLGPGPQGTPGPSDQDVNQSQDTE